MTTRSHLFRVRAAFLILILAASVSSGVSATTSGNARKFVRVELYFGFDRKGSDPVSENEWKEFLETEVTPRFPDGFSVLKALGHYRGRDGTIVTEESRIILLFFPKSDRKKNEAPIEAIRAAYKSKFNQESVLRLDFVKAVDIEF